MYAADHAQRNPDAPAIVMAGSGEVITYGEFEARSNQLAHLIRDAGLRRGDHMAIFMENHPRYLETNGGGERTGLQYTCVNSFLTAEEVAYIVNDCDARLVITSVAKRDVALEVAKSCPNVETWLMVGIDGDDGPFRSYEAAIAKYPTTPIADEELGAAMLYSSGTTGRPKGILRPLPDAKPSDQLPLFAFLTSLWRFRPGMTYLSPAPLYHSAPQGSCALTIRSGGKCVIMERFDPEDFLRLVEEHGITHSQVVPTMFTRLLKLPADVREKYDVSSLETIIHAAAPCPPAVKQQMIEWFGPIIYEYYAATEAIGVTFNTSEEWLSHPGTVGKAVLGEVVILDENGEECPVGQPGTVWFKGATNFEYYKAPEKTTESRRDAGDGKTMSTVGDVGYLDGEGYLYLTDRQSYMIISGGVNIYPQETEDLLISHPKVMDAAVFGVPNEEMGEEVKAVVQPLDLETAGPELERELIEHCRQHLAAYKCPRSIDFRTELPRLPTGKLYKRILRDEYWEGRTTRIV